MTKTASAWFGAVCSFAFATAFTTAAHAQDAGLFILKVSGDSGWTAECVLTDDRDREIRPDARGRGRNSSGALVGRDVVSGDCVVQAGTRGPLELRLSDEREAFACPFGERNQGLCRTVVPTGDTLRFSVRLN